MSPLLIIHIFLLWLSYLGFGFAFFSGLLFLRLEKGLKTKHLPSAAPFNWSLESLDHFNARTLVAGFLSLSVGIVAGVFVTKAAFGRFFIGDPSEVWTLICWLIYAGIVGIRMSSTLRGRKVMLLASLAFGMVLFTFIGVIYFFGGMHSAP